ncbi:MAG: hypothetical protein CVT88_08020 [Candidatus Altiarchaeales archaeon HGW-Altiarchaeales-1]|nr:MAG: hypothetical protein CVT88_08020 [Candidatus Altiarchaeales archaeon HGW-Altiarchaeales-1]
MAKKKIQNTAGAETYVMEKFKRLTGEDINKALDNPEVIKEWDEYSERIQKDYVRSYQLARNLRVGV